MSPRRGVLWMDRDGTILDDPGYLRDPAGVTLLPGAAEAIALANDADVAVVVITNQSGIERGLLDEPTLTAIHDELRAQLARQNARLDGIYHCPHLPAHLRPDTGCPCRKPQPALVVRARQELGLLDLPSAVVGDKLADLGLAEALGVPSVLVLTGEGPTTRRHGKPTYLATDVLDGVRWFLRSLPA